MGTVVSYLHYLLFLTYVGISDVVISSSMTSICVIPIQALMRYVGHMGPRPIDLLRCFWKYNGFWKKAEEISHFLTNKHDKDIDITRELTEKSHIRSFWPGEKIFDEVV